MGTRCLTHFERDGKILCTLYRQMDGYPDGHGDELANFLTGFKIVNGINHEDEKTFPKLANGLGCLAAQVIGHFKSDTSNYQRRHEVSQMLYETMKNNPETAHLAVEPKEPLKRDFRVGSFYIYEAGIKDVWEDYTYYVYVDGNETGASCPRVKMRCETELRNKSFIAFDGHPEDWDAAKVSELIEGEYEKRCAEEN